MALLSDLPPEVILQICSFVRPRLNGKSLLDGQELAQVSEESSQDYRNLNTLKSFCRTCKKYNGLRDSILFTSIVENHYLKESAVKSVATLLRMLLANPGGRTHVRSLHMFLYARDDIYGDIVHMPWPLSPSQVRVLHRVLENVAAAVGINTTRKIRDLDTGGLITLRGIAENTTYLRPDRLFGYQMLLLLLLVPGVQDLTFVINSGTLDWMRHIWATARLDGVCHSPILRLKSLAISDGFSLHILDIRFGNLFGMRPSSELYCELVEFKHAHVPFSNITSLALGRLPWDTTELCQVIQKFTTLNSLFLLASSSESTPVEAAAVVDALKKHARTLRTFCFQRHDWTDDKQDEYAVADLSEFVAMEKLWITATLLRSVDDSGHKVDNVLLKLPPSLKKLHLHSFIRHLVEDLRNVSEGAKRGDYSVKFVLSLDDTSKRGKRVAKMFRKRNLQVVVGDTRPVLW
ncbi:hypothetical protein CKAH01_16855 [Colletotrichum kahawae]|uniref:F-box domain-containing protein n=1 Tax=Colletotrichum kahawae TaxID=34407 RepID=A0AAE0D652_COLKA|nr:hypothetical protein CKAH01_16855 [Colletotrichum kahawae]